MRTERLRDGVLGVGCLAVLVGTLRRQSELDALRDPAAALTGVTSAVCLEWLFLTYPDRLLSLWERPAIHLGGAAGLLTAGCAARRRPRLLATAVWGLLCYLALLAALLAGWGNPVGRLVQDR